MRDKSANNGMLLLHVVMEDRGWLALGSGLSSRISTGDVNELLDEYFWPYSDAGRYDEAVATLFPHLIDVYESLYGVELYGGSSDGAQTQPSGAFHVGVFVVLVVLFFVLVLLVFAGGGSYYRRRRYGGVPMFFFCGGPRGPRGPIRISIRAAAEVFTAAASAEAALEAASPEAASAAEATPAEAAADDKQTPGSAGCLFISLTLFRSEALPCRFLFPRKKG